MDTNLLWTVVKIVVVVFLTVDFARIAWTKREKWLTAYTTIDWRLMLVDAIVVAATITVVVVLITVSPNIMGFSWLRVFGASGTNINTIGSDIPYFGIVFVLLLMLALPWLAQIEEELFREGTGSWLEGFVRSVIFGFVHMLVGIPLGAAIALIIPGMFYTAMYFKGGVELSTKAHFQYNLIVVSLLLVSAIGHTLVG